MCYDFEWKVYYIRKDILITIPDKENGFSVIDKWLYCLAYMISSIICKIV